LRAVCGAASAGGLTVAGLIAGWLGWFGWLVWLVWLQQAHAELREHERARAEDEGVKEQARQVLESMLAINEQLKHKHHRLGEENERVTSKLVRPVRYLRSCVTPWITVCCNPVLGTAVSIACVDCWHAIHGHRFTCPSAALLPNVQTRATEAIKAQELLIADLDTERCHPRMRDRICIQ
jgi:hypothetical protein